MALKVLLRLPLSPYSGYGNDGLGIARAFLRMGADVYIDPTVVQPPLPQDIADLLTKPLQAPFDLLIHHVDPAALDMTPAMKSNSKMAIGWTMWEFSNFGNLQTFDDAKKEVQDKYYGYNDIHRRARREADKEIERVFELRKSDLDEAVIESEQDFKKKIENFDAIIGYDSNTAECFAPYFDKPILIQQGGYNPNDWTELQRDWSTKEFYFCMIGVLSDRKNPFAAIAAFRQAKEQDAEFNRWARLSLKTSAPGLHHKIEDLFEEQDENGNTYSSVRIFYDQWPTETVKQFYAANHVLLAPSRGEGKNMPALEFMSTGGTVIATNWGGHTQWLSDQYAYPLDYTLKPIDTDHPDTLCADASVEDLTRLMLHCFHNRDEVRNKGKVAASTIPAISSWDSVLERLMLKLRDIPGGDELWMKYSVLTLDSE